MDARERADVRTEALPFEESDKLRLRGEVATFSRRYFPGLRRQAILVYKSESFEIHATNGDAKAVVDGEPVFLEIEGVDERGHISLRPR